MRLKATERMRLRVEAAVLQEQREEILAPAAQRRPHLNKAGQVLREPLVESGQWSDGQGGVITGMRRVDVIANLQKRSEHVTGLHADVATRFAKDFELSHLAGLRGREYGSLPGGGNGAGASPSQLNAMSRWRAARRAVGSRAYPLLYATAVENVTLKEWSRQNKVNQSIVLGQLLAILNRLADHYAGDVVT